MAVDSRIYTQVADLMALRQQAKGLSFMPKQPVGSMLAGRHGSKLRGRGLDFEELRHYRMGDDVRTIDWRVTKRTGKPHVRVFNEEKEHTVLLVVDQRMSMFFGSEYKMKSVVAAEVAALCGWQVLAHGDRVGAIVFNDERAIQLKPQRSERSLLQVFHQIEKLNNALNASNAGQASQQQLQVALQKAGRLSSHDGLIILISDLHGWSDKTLNEVKRLAAHNDVIVPFIFDPLEQDLPATSQLVVSDGEQQIAVNSETAHLQQNYREEFVNTLANLQAELRQYSVPVIPIDTTQAAAQQLHALIGSASKQVQHG